MIVATEVTQEISAPPETVFAYATDLAAIGDYFRGFGLVPGIRRVTMQDGAAPVVGATRRLEMADGSVLSEQILELTPPRSHAYRVSGFAAPLNLLARYGEGRWTFSPTVGGTQIRWHYLFQLTTPLAWPVVRLLVSLFMRTSMQRTLAALAARNWT